MEAKIMKTTFDVHNVADEPIEDMEYEYMAIIMPMPVPTPYADSGYEYEYAS
jgi:hypothetical protein